jgi:hypothetical protein
VQSNGKEPTGEGSHVKGVVDCNVKGVVDCIAATIHNMEYVGMEGMGMEGIGPINGLGSTWHAAGDTSI